MFEMKKTCAAAAIAAGLLALAGPSHADDFGNFAKLGAGTNIKWVQSVSKTGGHLFSGATAATVATNQNTEFFFNVAGLDTLGGLAANFLLDGTALSGNAATGVIGGTNETQDKINGSFSFTYTGPLAALTGSGCINTCTNLLTAHFTNALINGGQASAHFTGATTNPGATLIYTSDFIDFTGSTVPNFDFTLLVPAGTARVDHAAGKSFNSFRAATNGNFGATLAVPEPATWGLMIVGFGGIGAVMRRRRQAGLFA